MPPEQVTTPAPAATTNTNSQASTPATSSNPATPPAAAPAAAPAAKPDEPATFLDDGNVTPPVEETSFAAAEQVDEVEYELELAEDSLVPDADFDALVAEAKEKGLSKEEAEARLKLLDSGFKKGKDAFLQAESKRLLSELTQDEMFNTPEKQKAAKANIDRVYAAYKDPDFMKFVKGNPTVGNNKHFVKFLAKLGASLGDQATPPANSSGNPATPQKNEGQDVLKTLYPKQFE